MQVRELLEGNRRLEARFLPDDLAIHRFEWAVTLFAVPLLTAVAGFAAWRESNVRRAGRDRPCGQKAGFDERKERQKPSVGCH
jgi:hypothetical protein